MTFIQSNDYPTVYFGEYTIPNGVKPNELIVRYPIEWMVLEIDKTNGKALLITKNVIDWELFGTYKKASMADYGASWERSYLREWLNDDFYKDSFSEKERRMIISTCTEGSENSKRQITDSIFLLGLHDVKKYFSSPEKAISLEPMVDYCCDDGTADKSLRITFESAAWWTRTLGSKSKCVMCVSETGKLFEADADSDEIGVRPAMWIEW